MGFLSSVAIVLDRQNAVYFAGETIHGSLEFRIDEPILIKSIDLLIDGFTSCSVMKKGTTERYEGYDVHLKSFIYFLAKNVSEYELNQGDYNYKFELVLPTTLPSSFKHVNGETSYKLTAVFSKAWSMDKKIVKKITIISSFDRIPNLKPITRFKKNQFCCCCCKSEPVTASIQLDNEYCGINENVKFKVVINNESSKDLKGVEVYLVQNILYKPKNNLKVQFQRRVKSVKNESRINRGNDFEWIDSSIKIPIIQPTNKQEILELTYSIMMIVKTGPFSRDIRVDAEITIGTEVKIDENKKKLFNMQDLESDPFNYLTLLKSFVQ